MHTTMQTTTVATAAQDTNQRRFDTGTGLDDDVHAAPWRASQATTTIGAARVFLF